jgi:hypothetical protein
VPDQEVLWQKVLDAKLRLDLAWNYFKEVTEDIRKVPKPDWEEAYLRAREGQESARVAFLDALTGFDASVRRKSMGAGG